ncbi:MAG: membrane protein insertion efficiency factor YidD [Bacteroidetes bacterium CG12_big_fil_rev_8_21_14_0_65_60_17]|nr:MAG: membrane protein insertion efficiency factor YidD [Bacteroidetes bacterium CG12_big_fil_rev_8_21_14_0_65_60_17]
MSRLFIGLVRLYQLVISPHFPGSCNFSPTCSEYAIEALRKYGAVRGIILTVHRIGRCNPWGSCGYDPPVWYSERSDTDDIPPHEA